VSLLKTLPENDRGLHEMPRKKLYVGGLQSTVKKLDKRMTTAQTDEWKRFFEGVENDDDCGKCDELKDILNTNRSNHLDDDNIAKMKSKLYRQAKKNLTAHIRDDRVNHPDVTTADEPWVLRKFRAYNNRHEGDIANGDVDVSQEEEASQDEDGLHEEDANDVGDTGGWINMFGAVALFDTSNLGAIKVKGIGNQNATDNQPLRIGDLLILRPAENDTWRKFTVAILMAYQPDEEMMKVYWLDCKLSHRNDPNKKHDANSTYAIILRDRTNGRDEMAYVDPVPKKKSKKEASIWDNGTYEEWIEGNGKTKWPREMSTESVETLIHWQTGEFDKLFFKSNKLRKFLLRDISNRLKAFPNLKQMNLSSK
jgi:hypothetical protein